MTIDVGTGFVFESEFSSDAALPDNPKASTEAFWHGSFQGHHLIPTAVANKYSFLKALAQIDNNSSIPGYKLYNHNVFNENGMWLPGNESDSLASGLAMHRGGHSDAYNRMVQELLTEIESKHNLGNISNNTDFNDPNLIIRLESAAKELGAVEKYLRDGLMADRVTGADADDPDRMAPKFMINSKDPHGAAVGGFESGYPSNVVADYRDFLNLHFTNGDPVDGTPRGSFFYIGTAADPNMTNSNGEVVDPFERRAAIDPSFETFGIERFSGQDLLVEDPNSPQSPLNGKAGIVAVGLVSATGLVLVSSDPLAAEQIANDINSFLESVDSDSLADFAATAFIEKGAAATIALYGGKVGAIAYVVYEIGLTINDVSAVLDYFDERFPHWDWVDYVKPIFDLVSAVTDYLPEFEFDFPEFVALDNVNDFQGSNFRQAIFATGETNLNAGGGNDWLAHTGSGVLRGGEGHDSIVAITQYQGNEQKSLTVEGGSGNDWIVATNVAEPGHPQTLAQERKELIVFGGDGDDWVVGGGAAEFYLGAGNDWLISAGVGSVINAGPGGAEDRDTINMAWSRGSLVTDVDGYDKIALYGFLNLAGSYRKHSDSESVFTYGFGGAIKVGINSHGQLVVGDIWSEVGKDESFLYIANYNNSLDATSAELTAGVRMATTLTGAWQLLKFPGIDALGGDQSMWDFISTTWKDLHFRDEVGGVDPLVLDLDGDGLELTSMVTGVSPMFDMDGDGFAEHTGWVAPDDGMLALDSNGNGVIDDIGELFGGAGQSGFAELALHDDNSDGVIDANDAVYADLKVWRDLDRDGETDDGELFSLPDLNIQSIGLQATEDGSANALNVVERTGTFTYWDGTTGAVGDVTFRINNYDTVYTGDTTITPEVLATMPKLKGHGTLADLQVSVTLDGIDGALAQTINSVLPTLNVVDLDLLYERATAILNAWTSAAPVVPSTGSYSDVPAFISRADGQIDVQDFAYQTTETITLPDDSTVNVTFWKTAGGTPIKDDLGQTIEHPTLEQLLAHQSGVADLTWEFVSAEKFAFMERYFGEEIPINDPTGFSGSSVSGLAAMLETTERVSEQLTLRLAMQGGLKDYFDGVEYSVEDDRFRPTTDFELIPFFKKVFETSPADAAGAEAWLDSWKPLIDALLSDYERPGGNNINAPFIFTNVVAAYETIGLPASLAVAAESLGISPNIVDYGSGTRTGTNDQEIFYMSTGDDVVESKAGSDVFVFGENFGQDVINDYESGADDFDTIRFAHLTPEDIVATRDGKDLVLTVTATGDSVWVTGQFHDINYSFFGGQVGPFQGIEEIVFANGDVWGAGEIADAVSHPLDTDDTLIGTDHFDVLDGGLGNDFLQGGNNFDVYRFDAGYGQDTILDRQMNVGSEGMDVVMFGEGLTRDDISFYRDGNSNTLVINTTGGDGLTIQGQFFGSTALGQEYWIDRIESFQFEKAGIGSLGFSHEDVMRELVSQAKTDGDDIIYGFTFDDVLDGGAGNDTLVGGNKNDTYKFGFGYGSDTFDEGGANINVGFENTDRVLFGAGVKEVDVTLERDGNSADLTVRLSDGSEFKILRQFLGLNIGGSHIFAIETFEFEDGTVWNQEDIYDRMLQGTNRDDSLYGFWRDDVLDGGAGNDYLNGGDGNDTYVFGFGYGEDVVYDELVSIFTNENDKLLFGPGVTQADVTWFRNGDSNNLIATLTDGSQLTINSQFTIDNFGNKHYAIEHFELEDGSTISLQEIKDQLIQPTVGDDVLYGFASEDVFDGGAGNDVYHGGEYADTYHFGYGYGHDRINDYAPSAFIGGNDRIVFGAGIETSEVSVAWSSEDDIDLVLTVETGETITINNYRSKIFGFSFNIVEEVLFEDGTLWETPELMARYVEGAVSNGDDSIEGFGELGGEIRAQGGDDTIFGFSGDNTYVGGAGDDHITGGSGHDTYLYEVGDGSDIISERYEGGIDTLKLGAAIESADVVVKRNLNDIEDVILELSDGSEIVLDDQIRSSGGAGIESIVFNDGTVWTETDLIQSYAQANLTDDDDFFVGYATDDDINSALGDDEVYGGLGNDTITGGVGNDFLVGGRGADTYVFTRGDGADLIEDGGFGGEADKIVLHGYTPEEVIISQIAGTNDLQLSFLGTTDKITLKGNAVSGSVNEIAQIVFDNGQVWESSFVRNLVDGVIDTDGDDVLWGASSDDTLIGGLGNDHLRGGAGADTYVYTRGDGHDRITELQSGVGEIDQLTLIGVAPDDVTVSVSGETVLLTIASSTEGAGDAGSIALDLSLHGANGEGVERISFDDGTFWNSETLRRMLVDQAGSTVDDTLGGTSGANIISGGLGNDALNGGSGSDVYLYARGDGDDTITEGRVIQGEDTIRLEGMLPGDIALERIGNDLRIVIQETSVGAGDGGSILVKESLDEDFGEGIERVIFEDGTVWTRSDIRSKLLVAASTDGDDSISGFNSADLIDGGLGNDELAGGSGSDTYTYSRGDSDDIITEGRLTSGTDRVRLVDVLQSEVSLERDSNNVRIVIAESTEGAADGGSILLKESLDEDFDEGIEQVVFAGGKIWTRADLRVELINASQTDQDDTVTGYNTADTIEGGLGDDTLFGGGAGDTYLYSRGDGNDTISDGRLTGGTDKLVLVDLLPDDVILGRDGNAARIVIRETVEGAGDGGSITLLESLDEDFDEGVEQVEFSDGTIWSRADIRLKLIEASQTDGDDIVSGYGTHDTLAGGLGNDLLQGAGGDDTYVYARGDGHDRIVDGSFSGYNDKVTFTDINPAEVSIYRDGDHLLLSIAESSAGVGDGGSILIEGTARNWFGGGVDKVLFADGSEWSRSDMVSAAIENAAPVVGNDSFYALVPGTPIEISYSALLENDSDPDGTPLSIVGFRNVVGGQLTVGVNDTVTVTLDDPDVPATFEYLVSDGVYTSSASVTVSDEILPTIVGTSGNETLSGTNGDDVFEGGLGNDRFNSRGGSDTFLYSSGDGNDYIDEEAGSTTESDVLRFKDLNSDDMTFARSGRHLNITITATGETVTLDEQYYNHLYWGIDRVEFSDGVAWARHDLMGAALQAVNGTDGNDTITGTSAHESLYGSLGNDTINGGNGDDYHYGGAGDDILIANSGQDYFDGGAGADTLDYTYTSSSVTFDFANGRVIWSNSSFEDFANIENLIAGGGNDRIITSADDNVLTGGGGSDTFVFKDVAGGHDTVTDFSSGAGSQDLIEFGTDQFADFAAVLAAATDDDTDTTIAIDAETSVILKSVLVADLHQDDFQFV
ncbi:Ca2+-binding RTX toxin-like protein [Labrenzia sp. EL_13]|nr:Ca2+-binding RTX toxin-like protein [Labrenzia sp. EL_13]